MLQYVPQFREKTFVVAVDGAAVADENFVNILMDVAVLWSLSIRTVLVHGASDQIKSLAEQRGVLPSDLEGSGVTDAAAVSFLPFAGLGMATSYWRADRPEPAAGEAGTTTARIASWTPRQEFMVTSIIG